METRKIKIGFYKNSKTFFGSIIRLQQRLQGFLIDDWKFSHTEIIFCDLTKKEKKDLFFCEYIKSPMQGEDIFFSSSEIDGGVRFTEILEPKVENWDFIEIEIKESQFLKALRLAKKLNGSKYGTWSILFAQALNFNISSKGTYFCSQVCTIILNEIFINKFSKSFFSMYTHFINPAKLSTRLKDFLKNL